MMVVNLIGSICAFEDSIVGLSFYSPDGWLLDANKMMRDICHFDSDVGDAFFSKVNLFDMAPFNEVLDRYHPNEYLACSLSIIPEREMYIYLEIGVHPIYDEEGKLIYLSVAARDISEERQLYMQAKQNDLEIQKVNKSIQLYERELHYMMETCGLQAWRITLDRDVIEFYSGLSTVQRQFTLKQLQSIFYSQDDEFVRALDDPAKAIAKHVSDQAVPLGESKFEKITISVGVATYVHGTDISEIISAADRKLYKAKRNGKDQLAY